jgi:hypothetical protein
MNTANDPMTMKVDKDARIAQLENENARLRLWLSTPLGVRRFEHENKQMLAILKGEEIPDPPTEIERSAELEELFDVADALYCMVLQKQRCIDAVFMAHENWRKTEETPLDLIDTICDILDPEISKKDELPAGDSNDIDLGRINGLEK